MGDVADKHLPRIEGLLVLLLQKLGATSDEIAQVMDLGASTVRTKYPKSDVSPAEIQVEGKTEDE